MDISMKVAGKTKLVTQNLYKRITKRGGTENATLHPHDYMEMRKEVEHTELYLNRSIKLLRKYFDASEKYATALKELGDFFTETGRHEGREFGECLRKIGRVCVDVSSMKQTQILNVVYIQPSIKYLQEFEEGTKLHKKYLKKAEQYQSQEATVVSLRQQVKKDPIRLQQEEEKLKLLDVARDQLFVEAQQYTSDQLVYKHTHHMAELVTNYAEAHMLMEDLKPYLDQLQNKSGERAKQQARELKTKHVDDDKTDPLGYISSPEEKIVEVGIANHTETYPYQEYISMYDFTGGESEISLREGDTILVYVKDDEDWWIGCTKRERKMGYFPSCYCALKRKSWKIESTPITETEALYDYTGTDDDEINLKRGDKIQVKQVKPDGWWLGYNERSKQTGRFPVNYSKAGHVFK